MTGSLKKLNGGMVFGLIIVAVGFIIFALCGGPMEGFGNGFVWKNFYLAFLGEMTIFAGAVIFVWRSEP